MGVVVPAPYGCCRDVNPGCGGCPDDVEIDGCWRVRHEDWPAEVPSLWCYRPLGTDSDVRWGVATQRCGVRGIFNQNDCEAVEWFDGTFDDVASEDVTPDSMAPRLISSNYYGAAGAPMALSWIVGPSCTMVKVGLWVWQDDPIADDSSFNPFDMWNTDPLGLDTREPDYLIEYLNSDWHLTEFQIGPWIFTPVERIDPVQGPQCLRVVTTGLLELARVETHPDGRLLNCTEIDGPYPEGQNVQGGFNSFTGAFRKELEAGQIVWWQINLDRTVITLKVGASSTTFTYEEDWWLTARTVGSYTVSACPGPPGPDDECDVENDCFPGACPCIVNHLGELYRTIYADISGDITATELELLPDSGGSDAWQYDDGVNSVAILCIDPFYVSVEWGPDSYFLSIPSDGFVCTEDGLQIEDITISNAGDDITIRLYTL